MVGENNLTNRGCQEFSRWTWNHLQQHQVCDPYHEAGNTLENVAWSSRNRRLRG